jgi:hypothetical protein
MGTSEGASRTESAMAYPLARSRELNKQLFALLTDDPPIERRAKATGHKTKREVVE